MSPRMKARRKPRGVPFLAESKVDRRVSGAISDPECSRINSGNKFSHIGGVKERKGVNSVILWAQDFLSR